MNATDRERIIAALAEGRPDSLSDADIDAIYADAELRGLYEAMCLLRRAAARQPHKREHKFISFFAGRRRAAAAALICIAVASATAIFFATGRFHLLNAPVADDGTPVAEAVAAGNGSPVSAGNVADDLFAPAEDIVFENLTLDEIAGRLETVYGCKTVFGPDADHSLRLYMTIPAGTTLAGTVAILDSFDAISASLIDNALHIN